MKKIKIREEDFTDIPAQSFIRHVNCQQEGCKGHYHWNKHRKTEYGSDEVSIPHQCDACNHEVFLGEPYPTTVVKVMVSESVKIEDMREYEVWIEGTEYNGETSPASLLGTYEASSFREACLIHRDLMSYPENFNEKELTVYGNRLFDNESDARKKFC